MALIGDLLYPDNAEMRQKLNDQQSQLEKKNNLHNDLVNSYNRFGATTKTFDAYLMTLLSMHYSLIYTQEDLSDLPETDIPSIQGQLLDTIESDVMSGFAIYSLVPELKALKNGINAVRQCVGNLVTEGGKLLRSTASDGTLDAEAFSKGIKSEGDGLVLGERSINSAQISVMTDPDLESVGSSSSELAGLAEESGEAAAAAEESGAGASEGAASGAEVAAEATEVSTLGRVAGAAESAATAGAAFIGPAIGIFIAYSEIMGAINAKKTHDELDKAKQQMQDMLAKADKANDDIKDAYSKLLKAAKNDVIAYNKLLPDIAAVEQNPGMVRTFSTDGIDSLIGGMSSITESNSASLTGFENGAMSDLGQAHDYIQKQVRSDGQLTSVVITLKNYMAENSKPDIADTDSFLQKIADVQLTSMDEQDRLPFVQRCNQYRRDLAEIGSIIAPFHRQIQDDTPPGAPLPVVSNKPPLNPPDPKFLPKTGGLKFPNSFKAPPAPAA